MAFKLRVSDLLRLLEKQGYKCALTGRTLTPEACSLDHRIPVSRGGGHDIENVQLVVPEVNSAKGTMSQDEFVRMCLDVAETYQQTHHPVEVGSVSV